MLGPAATAATAGNESSNAITTSPIPGQDARAKKAPGAPQKPNQVAITNHALHGTTTSRRLDFSVTTNPGT
jgi:hypothetical protein